MAINQRVSGAAALTSSATAFSSVAPGNGDTFVVASAAGYPSSGRFVVQLSRGQSDEEKVLISSRSGTTFTVETRGYDDTTAASHSNHCPFVLSSWPRLSEHTRLVDNQGARTRPLEKGYSEVFTALAQ